MKKPRTNMNWTNHVLSTVQYGNIMIHELKIPDTVSTSVKFTNMDGVLLVTGDFGRWSFCREFIPSPNGRVSEHYWCEKLAITSTQQYEVYDRESTEAALYRRLEEINGSLVSEEDADEINEEIEWLEKCLSNIDDEINYKHVAYREYPHHVCTESGIIYETKIMDRLLIVFDAFEEICRRLAEPLKVEAAERKTILMDGMKHILDDWSIEPDIAADMLQTMDRYIDSSEKGIPVV